MFHRPRADRAAAAYERYEARGREDGRDMEDWFEAERELQRTSESNTLSSPDRDTDLTEAS
jgi:hypothetical protein